MPNLLMTPGQRAMKTARWATTMTKWMMRVASRGKKRWQLVAFAGPNGAESRGIVDLIAIRRDHSERSGFPRGDLFELILVQVKGGSAPMPSADDVRRLKAVAKMYRARSVVLAAWKKGRAPTFFLLAGKGWVGTDVRQLF